jgi:hypothetical protein
MSTFADGPLGTSEWPWAIQHGSAIHRERTPAAWFDIVRCRKDPPERVFQWPREESNLRARIRSPPLFR